MEFDTLFYDFRTGGYSRNVMVFPSNEAPYEAAYSPAYFAANSEHVTLPGELPGESECGAQS